MPDLATLLKAATTRLKECTDLAKAGDSCERAIDDAMKTRPGSLERINAAITNATREKQSWPSKIQEAQKLVTQLNADKTPPAIDAAKKLDAAAKSANAALTDINKKITDATNFHRQQQTDEKEIERALEASQRATTETLSTLSRQIGDQLTLRRQINDAKPAPDSAPDPARAAALADSITAAKTSNTELEHTIKAGEKIYKDGTAIVTDAIASFTNKLREAGLHLDRLHDELDKDVRKGKDSMLQTARTIQDA